LSGEFHLQTPKSVIRARLRSAPVPARPGERPEWILTLEDVTERKALEAQFLQAQKMESVGRLAGGVAHDFNNMLTAIHSFTRLAQDTLAADNPARHDLDMVLKAVEKATGLVKQLMAFARPEAAEPRVIDPGKVLVDLAKMLRRLIREDIELVVRPSPEPLRVMFDPRQLEQLMINLAVNAKDAMPHGGRLVIESSPHEISAAEAERHYGGRPGAYVMLTVSDTGIGMSEEVQAHLFEPFFTTKGPGKGTGLGLATVYGIVQRNGGHIEVTSAEGRGTTFRILLPQSQQAGEVDTARQSRAQTPKGSGLILLVEDDDTVRRLGARVLQACGYTVVEAREGEEALRVVEADPTRTIDLVITDVIMPRMGGLALAERISQLRPGIRILMMSGYSDELPGSDSPGIGTAQFIQKPFTPESLAARVHDMLQNKA
jgi:signal transduction histidine kinase/CheY-like chemotaxis protein